MDSGILLLFILITLPFFYILFLLKEWREKAEKWEQYQDIMYEGYVQNLEERLRGKDISFTEKVDYVFSKLKELRTNPEIGKPLVGRLSGLWRLRIGKYRAIYQIRKNELIVFVLRVGHRKNVYD